MKNRKFSWYYREIMKVNAIFSYNFEFYWVDGEKWNPLRTCCFRICKGKVSRHSLQSVNYTSAELL